MALYANTVVFRNLLDLLVINVDEFGFLTPQAIFSALFHLMSLLAWEGSFQL